jgi:hypothetical protein
VRRDRPRGGAEYEDVLKVTGVPGRGKHSPKGRADS